MLVQMKGLLIGAKRGEFTPEGKDAPVEYWRVTVQGADGFTISFGFDLALGDMVFGNAGSMEKLVNKPVEITADLSQYEYKLRLKGRDIHEVK